MTISASAVRFDDARLIVDLEDGRTIAVPLAWFWWCGRIERRLRNTLHRLGSRSN